jgi:hypothetical protein
MTPTRPSAASIGLGRPNDLAHFSVSWAMILPKMGGRSWEYIQADGFATELSRIAASHTVARGLACDGVAAFAEQIHRDRALWEAVAEGSNIRFD